MSLSGTVRDVYRVARDRNLTFMAAGIAHYTLASIVPLLLLALAFGTYFGSERAVASLVRNQLSAVLSSTGQDLVVEALTDLNGKVGAGIVGTVAALWSGSKVFRGLDVAFAELYDVSDSPSLVEQLRDALVVLGMLVLAVAATAAMQFLVARFPFVDSPLLVGSFLLFLTLVLVLLPIYYVLTPGPTDVGEILPGTAFAAVGFLCLQVGFLYYAARAGRYEVLGVVGALLLFVTWLYFGSVLLLVGGTLNYVRNHAW